MSTIDQQFIEFIVKSLVSKPDAVQIERRIDEKGVLLELTVDPEDLGRVIGKRGATAQSLRTLLRALGTKNEAHYNLKIIDNGIGAPRDSGVAPVTSTTSDDTTVSDDTNDDTTDDAAQSTTSNDTEEVETKTATESTEHSSHDDMVSKTRQELEDLDDLDL